MSTRQACCTQNPVVAQVLAKIDRILSHQDIHQDIKVLQVQAKALAKIDRSFSKANRIIEKAMAKGTAALVSNAHVGR